VIPSSLPGRHASLELKWYDGQGNLAPKPEGYPKLPSAGSLLYLDDAVISGTNSEIIIQKMRNSNRWKKRTDCPNPKAVCQPLYNF
jgi:hypothetical protein